LERKSHFDFEKVRIIASDKLEPGPNSALEGLMATGKPAPLPLRVLAA
jgi:hypothetical protein